MHKSSFDRIADLLREKIFFLDNFLELSHREEKNFRKRNFENLEELYEGREELIKNITTVDRYLLKIEADDLTDKDKCDIQKLHNLCQKKIGSILEQDLTLISFVENEKSIILKEIGKTSVGRRAIKGYRDQKGAI